MNERNVNIVMLCVIRTAVNDMPSYYGLKRSAASNRAPYPPFRVFPAVPLSASRDPLPTVPAVPEWNSDPCDPQFSQLPITRKSPATVNGTFIRRQSHRRRVRRLTTHGTLSYTNAGSDLFTTAFMPWNTSAWRPSYHELGRHAVHLQPRHLNMKFQTLPAL